MRLFLMISLISSSLFLAACNGEDDDKNNDPSTPIPNPTQSNCKVHCAP